MKTIPLAVISIAGLAMLAACSADDETTADYAADPNCIAAEDLGEGFFLCSATGEAPVAAEEEIPSPDAISVGQTFVESNCSACHAVGLNDESPLSGAPPFRELHEYYPVEDLAESLAEGIVTGHTGMPQFALSPEVIGDVISYLKTLE